MTMRWDDEKQTRALNGRGFGDEKMTRRKRKHDEEKKL